MSNYILYPVLELKYYIILSVLILFAETAMVGVMIGFRKTAISQFGLQGFLLGRTRRQVLYLTLGISEITFVLSMLIGRVHMEQCQIALLLLLVLGRYLTEGSVSCLISEVVFGALTGAALIAENLLSDFISETGFDLYIVAVWLLLALFVLGYCIYHQIKSIERMLDTYEVRKEKRRNRKPGVKSFILRRTSGFGNKKQRKEEASA